MPALAKKHVRTLCYGAFPTLLVLLILLLGGFRSISAETFQLRLVPRDVVESRLARYTGSDLVRATTLRQMFTEAGCAEHLSEQPVKGSKLPNIICIQPGSSENVIIVGAHFDHVSAGDGVVDNWSGASLLPSLYEAVKAGPRRHTYVFIGFCDEERGEIGSHFYARQMTKDQIAATSAMVNMDTLGLAPSEIWVSHSDKRLTNLLANLATQINLPVTGVNVDQVGSTDSVQFSDRKIPSITIHSLNQKTWDARILHTSKDKFSAIRLDDYYDTYHLVAAYLLYLDLALETPPGAASAH